MMGFPFSIRKSAISAALATLVGLVIWGCAATPPPAPPPPRREAAVPRKKPPPSSKPYRVGSTWYHPVPHARGFSQEGIASWYGRKFHGRKTSNGEIYNMYAMTAAHKTLPLGTWVRVHNRNNGKQIDVRVNDRGPFVRGRIIDLSYSAAKKIGIVGPGTAPVKIVALGAAASESTAKDAPPAKFVPVDYYRGNFTFQVGAFKNRLNAERLKMKLSARYRNAHIAEFDNGDGIFYRVRVGRCSTLEQAEAYEKILVNDGYPGAFIIAE